jgi:DNA-binding response OmpR family regulator
MPTTPAGQALVVDDEPANRDFVERLLQTAGYNVVGASTGAAALQAAKTMTGLTIALVDQELPDSTGLEIITKLRTDHPAALLVMATMHDDRPLIDQAFVAGIDVFLVKPHGFMELYRRLNEAQADTARLRRLVIDQYGPRPYKPFDPRKSQPASTVKPTDAAKATEPPKAAEAPKPAETAKPAQTIDLGETLKLTPIELSKTAETPKVAEPAAPPAAPQQSQLDTLPLAPPKPAQPQQAQPQTQPQSPAQPPVPVPAPLQGSDETLPARPVGLP